MAASFGCTLAALFIWTVFISVSNSERCSFSSSCICDPNGVDSIDITCDHANVFPTFSSYSGRVSNIEITGNFSNVPAKVFYGFTDFDFPNVILTRDHAANYYAPLTVDDDAFVTSDSGQGYESIYFYNYKNLTIPRVALSKVVVNVIQFYNGDYDTLGNYMLQDVQTASVNFIYCNIKTVMPYALDGIKIAPNNYVVVNFQGNGLKSVPDAAINFPGLNGLQLQGNSIANVSDNAFCGLTPCPSLGLINMEFNVLTSLPTNAFSNLPNLQTLILQDNLFTDVPTQALASVGTSLTELHLDSNHITKIPANSFYKLSALTTFTLDANPIMSIDAGAFNGLSAITALVLNKLSDLKSLDVLVTYGMNSLTSLTISNCPVLTAINVSSVTKLPSTLQSILANNGTDVRSLDSSLATWLDGGSSRRIDISYNKNFDCDADIQWMSPYVVCSPSRIVAVNTLCATSKVSLVSYLNKYQPQC